MSKPTFQINIQTEDYYMIRHSLRAYNKTVRLYSLLYNRNNNILMRNIRIHKINIISVTYPDLIFFRSGRRG